MKKLLFIVVALVVVIAATNIIAPFILQGALSYHLKKSGFSQIKGGLTKFNFTQAEFNNLVLQKKQTDGGQVTIQIPQIKIKYSIGSLLKGKLDGAIIKKLKIKIVLGKKIADSSKMPIIRYLPINWLRVNSAILEAYNLKSIKPWLVVQGEVKNTDASNPNKNRIILKFATNKVDFAVNKSSFGSFGFTEGKAKLAGTVAWNNLDKKLVPDINFIAEHLTGNFNDTKFTDLNGSLVINNFMPLQTEPKQRLSIAKINHNIVASDIAAIFSLQFTKQNKFGIFINAIKAKVADGSVYAKDFVLKNDGKKRAFELFVKNIDATKLIAIAKQKRLQAKGSLSGSLIVEYGATGFDVTSGSLTSNDGIVRYLVDKESPEFKSMNPAMQQVLEMLEDFHYKALVLSMGENTVSDQATIIVRAFGASPSFYANSPVDFNFNISGPLRRMLSSFFVGEDAKQYLLKLSMQKD